MGSKQEVERKHDFHGKRGKDTCFGGWGVVKLQHFLVLKRSWPRSSSREVRIRVPTLFFVLSILVGERPPPTHKKGKRALLGDLVSHNSLRPFRARLHNNDNGLLTSRVTPCPTPNSMLKGVGIWAFPEKWAFPPPKSNTYTHTHTPLQPHLGKDKNGPTTKARLGRGGGWRVVKKSLSGPTPEPQDAPQMNPQVKV